MLLHPLSDTHAHMLPHHYQYYRHHTSFCFIKLRLLILLDSNVSMGEYKACAIRETFEESGVLISEPHPEISPAEVTSARKKVHDDASYLDVFLKEHNLKLAVSALHHHANWLTPKTVPRRFNAHFFVTTLKNPSNFMPSSDYVETVGVNMYSPREAIDAALSSTISLYPPQFYLMCDLLNLKDYTKYTAPKKVIQYCPEPRGTYLALPGDGGDAVNRVEIGKPTKSGFVIKGARRKNVPDFHDFEVKNTSTKL